MGHFEDRVVIITGAARGLGREHALFFAGEGAMVVVNDLGVARDGAGVDTAAALEIAEEIRRLGGVAVANTDSVSDWDGARKLIQTAIDEFGDLHVLVNNAGIVRDRMLVNMNEAEWDSVIDVHLKGTFCLTRHAAAFWREKYKRTSLPVNAAVVCTSSGAGLLNNIGQANYGAAKAGVVAFAQIAAKELEQYGVRVNTIAPVARTRITARTPGLDQIVKTPDGPDKFDFHDPANISPLVGYLSSEECPYTGGVWHVAGGQVALFEGWRIIAGIERSARWSIEQLRAELPMFVSGARADKNGVLLGEGQSLDEALRGLSSRS